MHAPVGAVGSSAVGLKQGAHFSPSSQVSFGSCAACAATDGKQVDTQRPSAPATDVHVLGTKLPPVSISLSGAHSPAEPSLAVHVSRRPCCAAGTLDAGRQWAPPHAGAQSPNDVGSSSGGPTYGHMPAPASSLAAPPSPAAHSFSLISHAPVDIWFVGLMHGTHNSPSPQPSCPSSADCGLPDTSGMHFDKQTPAALPTDDVHAAGAKLPPPLMIGSGMHTLVAVAARGQVRRQRRQHLIVGDAVRRPVVAAGVEPARGRVVARLRIGDGTGSKM